jgi:hypothetical protein
MSPAEEIAHLKELLARHQELSRLQGNRLDELNLELGRTHAELRAAQEEIRRLGTLLTAKGGRV